jgi:hypothetical protein
MFGEHACELVNRLLVAANQPQLNDLQTAIFLQVWQGNTSQAIADQLGYRVDYINQVAARLWKTLATCLGQPVSRKNIKAVLQSYAAAHPFAQPTTTQAAVDWGEAIDVSQFYGRDAEREILAEWVTTHHCRVIGLFGLGGIGKTG